MRTLRQKDGTLYSIETNKIDLTHRICSYGEMHKYWKVVGVIVKVNGVFSVDVELLVDTKEIRSHLNLKIK